MRCFCYYFLLPYVALCLLACAADTPDVSAPPASAPPPNNRMDTPASRMPPADLAQDEEREDDGGVAAIREQYGRIQAQLDDGSLRADTTTVPCEHEDGEFFLVRYLDGDEVRMLRKTTGIGHAFTTTRYYFAGGELVFAWTVDEQFSPVSPPDGADEAGWESEYTETRHYVRNGEVIRQLTKTYEEQSWKDNPPPADLPNRRVDVPAGTRFPDLDTLEAWKQGRVAC